MKNQLLQKKKIIVFFFFLLILPLQSNSSFNIKFKERIETFILPNNLKVILLEDKRNPIIISSIWYKVGSSYEKKGITGISHVLEHMMFKGTDKVKPGEFSKIIKKLGGTDNAFTGRDFTGYYQKLHKKYIETSLTLESDRMKNLKLDINELEREINVVKEERRSRVDDRPVAKAFEKSLIQAFGYNGYGIPIIGTHSDLNNLTNTVLYKWYKKYYSPNNSILIIAGDFNRIKIKELIKKYFSSIKNENINQNKILAFKKIKNFKNITFDDFVSDPTILMSFYQPKFDYNNRIEHYKMELLLELMDGTTSSRFTKNLIEKKGIADRMFISFDTYPKHENLITIGGIPKKDFSPEILRNEILLEFKKLIDKGISDDEFTSLKTRLISKNIYELDSLFYQVMRIGMLESKNIKWEILDEYVDDINSIKKEDLINTANKYFLNKKFIYAVIYPKNYEKD